MKTNKKPSKEILSAMRATKSVANIALDLGVAKATVEKWLQSYSIRMHNVRFGEPTEEFSSLQRSVLVGNMLGDGCLAKSKANRNWLFEFGQRDDRKEYVHYVRSILYPFSKAVRFVKAKKPKSNDWCYSYRFRTLAHPLFSELRSKWYDGQIKVIPEDLQLDWIALAVWACDDGCNCIKNKCFRFSTDCFTHQEVYFLRDLLESQLGIISSVVKKKNARIISVTGESYWTLLNTLKPLIPWQCFAYKLRTGGSDGA